MSVSVPVIDHIDTTLKRIFLKIGVREYHPIDDIYKEVRYMRRTDESLQKFKCFVSQGGNIFKGGGKYTPRYIIYNWGYRVVPANEAHNLYVSGEQITDDGQSGPDCMDTTLLSPGVSVVIHYEPPSAEIVRAEAELAAIKYIGFNGGVSYSSSGYEGQGSAPDGTQIGYRKAPSSNLNDAHDMMMAYGLNNLYLMSSAILENVDFSHGHKFIGDSPGKVSLDIRATGITDYCEFIDLFVFGTVSGVINIWRECIIGPTINANSFIYNSAIYGTVEVLHNLSMQSCWIHPDAPNQEFILDLKNRPIAIIISSWHSGRVRVKNMIDGSFVAVSGSGGRMVLDATVTGGDCVYAGSIGLENIDGATPTNLKNSTVADQVWQHAAAVLVEKQIEEMYGFSGYKLGGPATYNQNGTIAYENKSVTITGDNTERIITRNADI